MLILPDQSLETCYATVVYVNISIYDETMMIFPTFPFQAGGINSPDTNKKAQHK